LLAARQSQGMARAAKGGSGVHCSSLQDPGGHIVCRAQECDLVAHLQSLGLSAMGLLEGGDGGGHVGGGAREDQDQDIDATFEQCFYICGGQQSFEELEALGNEAARICNRARSRALHEQQAAMDAALSALGPLFDLTQQVRGAVCHSRPAELHALAAGGALLWRLGRQACCLMRTVSGAWLLHREVLVLAMWAFGGTRSLWEGLDARVCDLAAAHLAACLRAVWGLCLHKGRAVTRWRQLATEVIWAAAPWGRAMRLLRTSRRKVRRSGSERPPMGGVGSSRPRAGPAFPSRFGACQDFARHLMAGLLIALLVVCTCRGPAEVPC
jgi:hypothetical protein